jgi:hypothetical protein
MADLTGSAPWPNKATPAMPTVIATATVTSARERNGWAGAMMLTIPKLAGSTTAQPITRKR